MNSFLTRYSSTSPEADIRKAKELYGEDEDFSEIMWGSSGGFGNLASGVPMFKLPSVQDVRCRAQSYSVAPSQSNMNLSVSLPLSFECTRTTTPTLHAVSKSSTVRRHWRSDSREVLLSRWILELRQEAMLVSWCFVDVIIVLTRRSFGNGEEGH